ncbi:MAG: PhzF family phenazine biosynthesis protein, partial [Saprospiraceae bacterium]
MKNTLPTYIVDSFTNEPFKGNPAGVCLPESPLSEEQMQAIAKELGFS